MIPGANVQPRIQTQTHTHTHSHLPLAVARAKLPRLNYKCFSGLELQDIMKQCGTLRGNYPAALPAARRGPARCCGGGEDE